MVALTGLFRHQADGQTCTLEKWEKKGKQKKITPQLEENKSIRRAVEKIKKAKEVNMDGNTFFKKGLTAID